MEEIQCFDGAEKRGLDEIQVDAPTPMTLQDLPNSAGSWSENETGMLVAGRPLYFESLFGYAGEEVSHVGGTKT